MGVATSKLSSNLLLHVTLDNAPLNRDSHLIISMRRCFDEHKSLDDKPLTTMLFIETYVLHVRFKHFCRDSLRIKTRARFPAVMDFHS